MKWFKRKEKEEPISSDTLKKFLTYNTIIKEEDLFLEAL